MLTLLSKRAQLVKVSQTVTENNQFVEETEMVYTYDGAGNRLSAVKTSSGKILCNIQYTYNDNSQITDIESDCDDDKQTHIVLTYDENGNLKNTTCNDTEKVRDYTYDNENRLKAVKENGSLLMAALYDGNGDRIFRLDYRKNDEYVSNKAGTAENVYYPSGSVNSAYDTDVILNEMLIPNGVTQNTAINYELTGYINDINTEYTQTLMEFGANGNTTNVYEYGDGRNSATINGTKGYYLYDGRGSVAGLTGNTGGSMITYRYDAYGNTTKSNNTLNNPYQYNAEYTDSSTGLQYLRARYYDSSQGRFTTKDSVYGLIQLPITFNPYTYVCNNPLNLIDPSGEFFKGIFGTVAGGARALWDGAGGLVTGKGTSGFKSGWNKGKADGQRVGAKLDNSISRTVQRNVSYYSAPNSLHINPNTSEIYNGGPYYTNIRDGYYQAQSQRVLKNWTALETKAQNAVEWARKRLCEKADRIVAQQIAQDNMQMEIYQAQVDYFTGTAQDGEKRLSGPGVDENGVASLSKFHDGGSSGLWSGKVDVYGGYAKAEASTVSSLSTKPGKTIEDPALLKFEAETGVISAKAEGKYGTEYNNVHINGDGTILSAGIEGNVSLDKNGAYVGVDAMASIAEGSVSTGTTIAGVTVDMTAKGHVGAVGGSGKIRYEYGVWEVEAEAALGIGGGVGFKIDFSKLLE